VVGVGLLMPRGVALDPEVYPEIDGLKVHSALIRVSIKSLVFIHVHVHGPCREVLVSLMSNSDRLVVQLWLKTKSVILLYLVGIPQCLFVFIVFYCVCVHLVCSLLAWISLLLIYLIELTTLLIDPRREHRLHLLVKLIKLVRLILIIVEIFSEKAHILKFTIYQYYLSVR
jgi:hypothetical protein